MNVVLVFVDVYCHCVYRLQTQWTYRAPAGVRVFEVNMQGVHERVTKCNSDLNGTLSQSLKEYYIADERIRVRMELQLVDPNALHGKTDEILRHHGMKSMNKLLDFYADRIPREQCLQEYNEWKLFAVRETDNWVQLSLYDGILAMYSDTMKAHGKSYLNWFKLYKLILLNWSSSMALERLFRSRKLFQPATHSNYTYEGLSDRLLLRHNSATPGTADSVVLYMKAQQKWLRMKKKRLYGAISPLDDVRLHE